MHIAVFHRRAPVPSLVILQEPHLLLSSLGISKLCLYQRHEAPLFSAMGESIVHYFVKVNIFEIIFYLYCKYMANSRSALLFYAIFAFNYFFSIF